MSLQLIAKELLKQVPSSELATANSNDSAYTKFLSQAELYGFSPSDLLAKLQTLYAETGEDPIKIRIIEKMLVAHGLLEPEQKTRAIPQIIINVAGDNTKVAAMLCP